MKKNNVTHHEMAEYCTSLQKIGSHKEALLRLENLDYQIEPQILIYKTFCLYNTWNFMQAIPLLETYIGLDNISDYQRLIGEINLIAALVVIRNFPEAKPLLDRFIRVAKKQGFSRLQANALELYSQIHIEQRDYRAAKKTLEGSLSLFGDKFSLDRFFAEKWLLVIQARVSKSTSPIQHYRKLAKKIGHVESLRDADYQELRINDRPS
ncbi:hypothetical protein COB52_06010, partial [Candidatus Kaiserbacteria bacterium]